ncbi:MAG: amino acid adenylation domain-containing protein, partial [Candidatus Aminicenantes bacterium]
MMPLDQLRHLDKKDIEDVIALTPMQEGMLFHYLKEPESDLYYEQLSLNISGDINVQRFETAWNFVIDTNEILRTVFRWEKLEKPVQIILKEHKIQLKYYDYSNKNPGEKQKWLEQTKVKDRKEKFNLQEVPFRIILCKVEPDNHEMIISNHHILYDGWSNGIILEEFFKAYNDLTAGKELQRPVKTRFREFVKWIQHRDLDEQEKFWRDYLKGFDTLTELTIKRRKGKEIFITERFGITLSRELKDKLEGFVKNHKITLAAFLYSAWGILLQKYCHSGDIIFGTTVSGRTAPIKGIKDMVGLFINTIPLRVKISNGERIEELLGKINHILPRIENNGSTPLVEIKGYSELKNNQELFDSIMVLENYPVDRGLTQGNHPLSLVLHSYSMVETTTYDLTIGILIGDDIEISYNYNKLLFEKVSIRRLSHHFMNVIERILKDFTQKVSGLEILAKEEKEKILFDFNNTTEKYPKDKTIHKLFEEQTRKTPGHIALILADKELTYRELNKRAAQLSRQLQSKRKKTNTIVGLMVERSIEMIIGILAILKCGDAYLPIDPDYPGDRIEFMLADSASERLVTAQDLSNKINFEKEIIYLSDMTNRVPLPPNLHPSPASTTSLAYVIYTSGSTGKPKGVLVEHGSVINLAYSQKDRFDINERDRILQFSTICFDASVEQIFIALFSGAGLVLIDRGTLLDDTQFQAFIASRSITHLHAVPAFLDNMRLEDIYNLKRIISGGDVCPVSLAKKWNKYCDFYNEYGPTETTVTSIEILIEDIDESLLHLPIGRPINNTLVYLFDQWLKPVPLGVVGELYIGGDGVARGYLNRPQLTAEKFVLAHRSWFIANRMEKKASSPGELPMSYQLSAMSYLYKTGDLARWLPDGNLEFLGRSDQQVKIRGFRIELGEIENRLSHHKNVKDSVVICNERHGQGKFLCAYIVSDIELDMSELRGFLSLRLPDYMIPSYWMQLDEIPLTPNGKVDRKALPEMGIVVSREYVPPANEREKKLVEIWSNILGYDGKSIGVNDHFFQLGGHSLKAVGLIGRIHKVFSVKISVTQLFKTPTVKAISDLIARAEASTYSPIAPVEEKGYYPLSPAQKRFFLVHQMNPLDISYHLTAFMVWDGPLERKRFEEAFKKLIKRHQSLRTSFEIINEEPVQKVHDQVEFEIDFFDAERNARNAEPEEHGRPGSWALSPANTIQNFVRPFDLSLMPLMRVGLIKLPHTLSALHNHPCQEGRENKYLLMFDMHHIISDGISVQIFIKEFTKFYQGEVISELRIQYKDFSHWQNTLMDSGAIKQQESYWLEYFADEIPVLILPYDFSRPITQTHEGSSLEFKITLEQTRQLKQLALESETTIFIVLLAVFNLLVSKLSGQEDIVVGSPVAGRRHPDLESVMGIFINTLALRNYPAADRPFDEFLAEVKKNSLDAFENQDYQYEELVEKIEPQRDLSRNPLFDVMLVVQNMDMEALAIPGIELKPFEYPQRTSKFDMTVTAVEKEHQLDFTITYSTALFTQETVLRFIKYFKRVLAAGLKDIKQKIAEIDILADDEKKQLLYGFNLTEKSYSRDKALHRLFEEQVEQTPGHIAVIGPGLRTQGLRSTEGTRGLSPLPEPMSISYKELNKRSNQLAQLLRRKGISRDTITAIMMDPFLEMMIGILAVLKAGGAYLPIDPQQQAGRVTYMLNDSRAVLLLTRGHLFHSLAFGVPSLAIDGADVYKGEGNNLERKNSPADVVYTIYTSGTTGKSKGTLIENKNLVNYVCWFREKVRLTGKDRTVLTSSFSFDLGYSAIYPSILTGCQLHFIPRKIYLSPENFIFYINQHGITYIKVTPSLFTTIVENSKFSQTACHMLRLVVLGGEEIKLKDVARAHRIAGGLRFMNHYGPTEATIGCVAQFIDFNRFSDYRTRPTIGHPIHNMKVVILDNQLKLVPVGVSGELGVSGAGVVRGYLNRPQLTAEKFDHDFWDYHDYHDEKKLNLSIKNYKQKINKKL